MKTIFSGILAFLISTSGCLPTSSIVQGDHVQKIVVHTIPEGAIIWQRFGGEAVELGQAPVTLQGGYTVLQRRYHPEACALEGAGAGLEVGEAIGGEAGAAIGLIGLLVGAATGAAACANAGEPPEVEGSQIVLVATLQGYLTERHVVQIPRGSPVLTLRLIPDPNAVYEEERPEPMHAEQAEPGPSRSPALPGQASPPPASAFGHHRGLSITSVQIEVTGAELSGDIADRLTSHLATALDRVGFAGPDTEGDASEVLETRLLAIGELCILSATLYRTEDRKALRVASARGACDLTSLDASIDRLAAQLSPDVGKVVAGP